MSSTTTLDSLLGVAVDDAGATQELLGAVDTLGPAIQAGLGDITVDDIDASEVVLVTLLVDDSGSIRFGGNAQLVRDGHNLVLSALKGSKQSAAVLISCWYLNDGPLYPYVLLDNAPELTTANYDPNGGTPLYDQTVAVLAAVTAKLEEFKQGGVAARAITAIITDGADAHSHTQTPAKVKTVVDALLRSEEHIIAAVGIDDGSTNFKQVFQEMGLLSEWIKTPQNTESDIRRAFQTVSQSAVRASQTAGSFSQTALGGFDN